MFSTMIDIGSGPPLVMIPGLQGRWEWMRPAVEALATRFRVLSFSLAGDPGSDRPLDPHLGFDSYMVQIDRCLEEAGIEDATICGVSYGGLIALRYASLRPKRTRHLVLVSALPPDYVPDARYHFYAQAPWLLLPVFWVESAWRVRPELRAALPRWSERARMAVVHGLRILRAPASPARMRQRMELLSAVDFTASLPHVNAPTLVVMGEPGLDRTVPVELTRRYLDLLGNASTATLARTGHLGTITRPDALASLVSDFVSRTGPDSRARESLAG
jgi:3-oxoadipate enol-lactonase